MKSRGGFTLIEMLLSVACLAIIAAISIPIYQSFQTRNDLNIASGALVQSLRRAQILAQGAAGDTNSGVKIQSGSITIFRGINYAVRDVNEDEIFSISTNIIPSGIDEVIFSKTFGWPSPTGSITLTSNINEVKTIIINEKGTLTY